MTKRTKRTKKKKKLKKKLTRLGGCGKHPDELVKLQRNHVFMVGVRVGSKSQNSVPRWQWNCCAVRLG